MPLVNGLTAAGDFFTIAVLAVVVDFFVGVFRAVADEIGLRASPFVVADVRVVAVAVLNVVALAPIGLCRKK